MRKLKKAYQYLFYKFYRFSECMAYPWWSEIKAFVMVSVILVNTFFISGIYYNILIDRYIELFPNKTVVVIMCLCICGFNYYVFLYKNRWKAIVAEFDKLPKTKNRIGSWCVVLFVCIFVANFIYSFYLLGSVDWSQYR